MKVEIFRNTVKRRGKGASFEMMKAWFDGIKAVGDEPIWIQGKGDPERWMGDPQEKVAVQIAEQIADYLLNNKIANQVNS